MNYRWDAVQPWERRAMGDIKQILVIVDPTAQRHPAVEKAALLAEKFRARLELFVCDTKAARETRIASYLRKRPGAPVPVDIEELLESLAAPLRERGLDVTTETVVADPLHVGLIERTRHTDADLVVKDTHHHSLAQRTFLTNTDWMLIRHCPVPLLLTKAAAWAATPRIVAAVDPGHVNDKPKALDHRIVAQASLLAQRLQGELHLLHVYVPLAAVGAATIATPSMAAAVTPEDFALEQQNRRKLVESLVSEHQVAPENIHLELGGPAQVLPIVAARLQADVMTMGAIARSGLKRIFVGSTAEDVLERLPCDALVVKASQTEDSAAL
jgi:universal stress protein E